MLLWLVDQLAADVSGSLGALAKITPRAALAALVSFVVAVVFGSRVIRWLREWFREPIASDSARLNELHRDKQQTPTMGGLFIVAGILGACGLLADAGNPYVLAAMLGVVGLATLGACDDLAKLRQGSGLSARVKLTAQTAIALVVALLVWRAHQSVPGGLELKLGGLRLGWSLGGWFVPLAVVVIVGASNAVNLTDGLDGLAGGCLVFAASGLALLVYASGHALWAQYLNLTHVAAAGEMTVVAAAMIGGVLGFLWFNCHPAQVFMGDTGSLPLGGLLGILAVVCRQELLLVVIGGVFVVEAASVMIQVLWYKWTRRRVFLCAPLHHHFQFLGWPESRIVVRFWIAAALCAVVGVGAVKLTAGEDTPHSATAPSSAVAADD